MVAVWGVRGGMCVVEVVEQCVERFMDAHMFFRAHGVEGDVVGVCPGLGVPLVREVSLVAEYTDVGVLCGHFSVPLIEGCGGFMCAVVGENDDVGGSVVGLCDGAKSFLSRGVPELDAHGAAIFILCSVLKVVHPDGGAGLGVEGVVDEALQDGAFPRPGVSDDDDLVGERVARVHGSFFGGTY